MKERFYDPTFNTRSPETDENYRFLLLLLLLLVSVCPSLNIIVDRLHFLQNGEAYEQVASITAVCTSKLPRLFRPQAIIRACSFGARARATDRANVKYRVFLKHVGSTMDTDEYDKRGKLATNVRADLWFCFRVTTPFL